MNCKWPCEGYRRQAPSFPFLPAFPREKDVWVRGRIHPPFEELAELSYTKNFQRAQNPRRGGRGVLPYKRLKGICHRMGSHFHEWSDYKGVAFSIELLEWGCKFLDFGGTQGFKMGRFPVKKIRKLLFIKFNNKLALTALHSILENTT